MAITVTCVSYNRDACSDVFVCFCWCQLLKRNEATDDDGSVSYDYSYKRWSERDVTADDQSRYRWTTTTWSPCNATCGTGEETDLPLLILYAKR